MGECCIHGLKECEALPGPLPSSWQRVIKQYAEEARVAFDCFINRAFGETRLDDPRLGPLPPGWRVADHEEKRAWNRYLNDSTGEGYDMNYDPRMTAEALRDRGVKLTEFRLI